MVFFDLSFKSMLIEEIVEDKGSLWTYGRISWLSINRGFYEVNKVHVFMVPFVLASAYHGGTAYCFRGRHFERLVGFFEFLIKQKSKIIK